MYHSPPPIPKHVRDRSLHLGWFGYVLLAGMPSALAALAWLSRYETMPYHLLVTIEAIMLGGVALSAMYWQANWARALNWYSGFLVLGGAWGVGYGILALSHPLFHSMPAIRTIDVHPVQWYSIEWNVAIGATAVGLVLACAQWYLRRPTGLAGRAALMLTALGNTIAWIGLFPLILGADVA